MIKKYYKTIVGATLLAFILYFPLFLHLSYLPVHIWDEARLAVNAFEMTKNHQFIVTHYDGEPDMWNVKPPLMIWAQVFFMKLIGYSELAIRIPSALAALFTCLNIIWFSKKVSGKYQLGILAVLILITSSGYVANHISRSGDYDALLVFFTFSYLSNLFIYTENNGGERKYLIVFFVSIILAVLTKGVAGVIFLPAIIIYIAIRNKWKLFLADKYFYLGIASFFIVIGGYYYLRELKNPGYIIAVMQNEVGGRFLDAIDGNKNPFNFYFRNILESDFKNWYLFFPAGLISGILIKNDAIRKLTAYMSVSVVWFLLVISFSETKCHWYSAPAMPLLSVVSAVFFFNIYNAIMQSAFIIEYSCKPAIAILPFFLFFIIPYYEKVNGVYFEKIKPVLLEPYELPYYLQREIRSNRDISGIKILYENYNASIEFYCKLFKEKKQETYFFVFYNPDDYKAGDRLAVSQERLKVRIENDFYTDTIEQYRTVTIYNITGRK